MNRFTVESIDPYDMEIDPDGMWVMHDDAMATIAAAVAAERKRCALLCETWMEAAERESGPEAAGWLHQIAQHMRGGN